MNRVSVIIPVYNGARFIRDALRSVCAQSHMPAEVVVADDCSTDNTGEVVAEFARTSPVPVTLFSMEKNTGGPYGPARAAFLRTTGDYVCILDADDLFAPDAFATYVAMFAADPGANVGLATSDYLTFSDQTGETVMPSYFGTHPHVLRRILADSSPTGLLLDPTEARAIYTEVFAIPFKGMVRREAWTALGGPNLNYLHVCDVEFVWRLIARTDFRVRVANRPLVRVRVSPGSMSSNRVLCGRELVRLLLAVLADTRDPAARTTLRRRIDRELLELTYESYKQRSPRALVPALCALLQSRIRRLFRSPDL